MLAPFHLGDITTKELVIHDKGRTLMQLISLTDKREEIYDHPKDALEAECPLRQISLESTRTLEIALNSNT